MFFVYCLPPAGVTLRSQTGSRPLTRSISGAERQRQVFTGIADRVKNRARRAVAGRQSDAAAPSLPLMSTAAAATAEARQLHPAGPLAGGHDVPLTWGAASGSTGGTAGSTCAAGLTGVDSTGPAAGLQAVHAVHQAVHVVPQAVQVPQALHMSPTVLRTLQQQVPQLDAGAGDCQQPAASLGATAAGSTHSSWPSPLAVLLPSIHHSGHTQATIKGAASDVAAHAAAQHGAHLLQGAWILDCPGLFYKRLS